MLSPGRAESAKAGPWTKDNAAAALFKEIQMSDTNSGYQSSGKLRQQEKEYVMMEREKKYVIIGSDGKLQCSLCSKRGDIGHFLGVGHCKKVANNAAWEATELDTATTNRLSEARRLQEEQLEQF